MATILSISQGGTSATDAQAVRTALGLRNASLRTVAENINDSDEDRLVTLGMVKPSIENSNEINSCFTTNGGVKVLNVSNGGTGVKTIASLKSLLGITTLESTLQTVPIKNGGTGSTSASGAIKNLLPTENRLDGNVLQISGSDIVWNSIPVGPSNKKNITVTGAVSGTGTINFNGTSDVTINTTAINPQQMSSIIPVTKGGTGAASVSAARSNLGLGTGALRNIEVNSVEPDPTQFTNGDIWIQFIHETT